VLDLLVLVQIVIFFFNMYSRHLLLIAVELGWIIIMLTPLLPFLNENTVCVRISEDFCQRVLHLSECMVGCDLIRMACRQQNGGHLGHSIFLYPKYVSVNATHFPYMVSYFALVLKWMEFCCK
jgi:hypothetical protein